MAYAEGTTVSVETSRGEITGILAKNGVQRMGWYTEPERDVLQFEIGGRGYRLEIVRPLEQDLREVYDATRRAGMVHTSAVDFSARADREWRRRWRATVLLLKAKLEFADGETSTVERELMPYMLLKDGRTLEAAITAGAFPQLAARAGS